MRTTWGAALAAAAIVAGTGWAASAQEIVIRIGLTDPLDTPYGQAMVELEQTVEAGSDGRIDVQLFPSAQLGSIVEQLENVRQGAQEMSMASPGWFSQFYPRIDMLEMPFLVTDWDQAQRMLDSQAFEDLKQAAQEEADIMIYGNFPYGFRNIANCDRAVATLEDLKGLKLRVQNSPAHLATFRALGASPVALAWDETYQAVQTGVVDGLENANTVLLANKYPEIAPYVSTTHHLFGMLFAFMNPDFYQSLSDQDRALLDEAMDQAEARNIELSLAAESSAADGLRDLGAKINDVAPEVIEQMRQAVQPVYQEFGAGFQPELGELQAAAQQAK
jgi:tripartite ATP-independent transporter DctP family solute receptor